ncbi:serine protease gd-like [Sitophilus oryzae]|uniref:Serine protease gd-like n=1 Tax=Sitophilus oryzae TaxID=7048 RepID=A0A6J2XUD2_SITOR|nr:serine protease gd-like [Sitophilus oryzae]
MEKFSIMIFYIVIIFTSFYKHVICNSNYNSPCPEAFQYRTDSEGRLYGEISIEPAHHDGSSIQISVEMSVANSVQSYLGKLVLTKSLKSAVSDMEHNRPVQYWLYFPAWHVIPPKITKIEVNCNQICSGPSISMAAANIIVTSIILKHKFSSGSTLPATCSSQQKNKNDYNNHKYTTNIRNGGLVTVISSDHSTKDYPHNIFFNSKEMEEPLPNSRPMRNPFPDNPFFDGTLELKKYNFTIPYQTKTPITTKAPDQPYAQNPFLSGLLSTRQPSTQPKQKPIHNQPSPKIPLQINTSITGSIVPQNIKNNDMSKICGRPVVPTHLIVKGQSVPRGAYPWLVAMFLIIIQQGQKNVRLEYKYICGGSLISNKHVVTDYRTGSANADIALLKFEDIEFNPIIKPLCLWAGANELNLIVGRQGTVVGWGRDENKDMSQLRQLNLPIVSQEKCLRSDKSPGGSFLRITSEKTFCAGFRNGSGPCDGDSGSGFLLNKNGVFFLRGIVSTALMDPVTHSCNLDEYVVFTDASKYSSWLLNEIT